MTAPDQTNAEVSDERLREIIERLARNFAVAYIDATHGYTMEFAPSPAAHRDEYDEAEQWAKIVLETEFRAEAGAETYAALNRRSVTSQASEGAELTEALTLGWWNSKDLKLTITETGEVMTNDREALRAIFDALPEVPHGGIKGFDVVPAAPVSKRVERLETALKESRQWLQIVADEYEKASGEPQHIADTIARIDQALQGGRS